MFLARDYHVSRLVYSTVALNTKLYPDMKAIVCAGYNIFMEQLMLMKWPVAGLRYL